jgi:hypothetical protein
MKSNSPSIPDKWSFTLYTTLVVFLIFNPWTYKLVNSLLSDIIGSVANSAGYPTPIGFAVHLAVFTIIIRFMMDLHL